MSSHFTENLANEAVIHTLYERLAQLEEENLLLEEVLLRNSRMFEALISNAQDGITLTGPDRRIVRVIKGLTGIDPAALTGQLIDSLAVPEDRPTIGQAYEQLLTTRGGKIRLSVRVLQIDGGIALYSATLTDMLDDPNVQGIVWNYSAQTAPEQDPPFICEGRNHPRESSLPAPG